MSFFQKFLAQTGVLLFFILLLCYTAPCVEAGKTALLLCFQRVIPSLFPFFVISRLVISSGLTAPLGRLCGVLMDRVFHMKPQLAAPFLLGLTGGYPLGAATIAQMVRSGQCTRQEGNRLLAFASNTGPAFAVGICGVTLFGSVQIGGLLYGIHVLSAVLTGFFLNRSCPRPEKQVVLPPPEEDGEITAAIRDSFSACLSITGFVVFFSVLTCLLGQIGLVDLLCRPLCLLPGMDQKNAAAFLWGMLEITGGLSAIQVSSPWALPLCSLMLAFGGISVVFQTRSVLDGSGLSIRSYLRGKCLQSAFAFFLTFIFSAIFR